MASQCCFNNAETKLFEVKIRVLYGNCFDFGFFTTDRGSGSVPLPLSYSLQKNLNQEKIFQLSTTQHKTQDTKKILIRFYEMSKQYTAALLGGSGSVGKHVLTSLLEDSQCTKVILLSRRKLDDLQTLDPARVQVQVLDPLDDMSKANLTGTNVAFCTLGHGSSRKSTKDDLLRVDATIPGAFAKACQTAGVTHYCLMTAVGSDESSKWSPMTRCAAAGGWYNHVKGVAERMTQEAEIPYTYIAQPATLLGSPHSPKIVQMVPNCILPDKFSSAHVADIAKGMVNTTIKAFQQDKTGVVKTTGGVPISKGE